MMSAKPFFNCPCRVSRGMFLQNISLIGLFINVLGLPECQSGGRKKKKKQQKKKKKKVGKGIGDPVSGRDAPIRNGICACKCLFEKGLVIFQCTRIRNKSFMHVLCRQLTLMVQVAAQFYSCIQVQTLEGKTSKLQCLHVTYAY